MKASDNLPKKTLKDRLDTFRPAGPFLLAVLISSTIWVINSLNNMHVTRVELLLDYPHTITAPVKGYTRSVTVEISGKGFDLIRFLLKKEADILKVSEAVKGRVHAQELVARYLSTPGLNLHINRVSPVWIDPPQKQYYSKKLKVIPGTDLRTAATYVKTIPAICIPDSLTVYSELPVPEALTTVYTEKIEQTQLKTSWFGSVKPLIEDPDKIIPETNKIWVYQPVEEATEITLSLPVNPGEGIPYNFRFIPASVTLTCIVPISRYAITSADKFLLTASISSPEQDHALIKILHSPSWAMNIHYTPNSVEFLKITP